MLRTLLITLLCLASPAVVGQTLPPEVPTRVGRAAAFVYRYTPEQYAARLTDRDIIWSNQPTSEQGGADRLTFPSTVFSGASATINRVPANVTAYGTTRLITACTALKAGGCPLSWFQEHHPEWIIYKSDQATPAYQFDDPSWIPLDISNMEVQAWVKENFFLPILKTGYHALSIDNVTVRNDFGEAGVCSIVPRRSCTLEGGVWKQLYTGQIMDPAFVKNRILWARSITEWAHAAGKSTIGNVTYNQESSLSTAELVNAFDVWYDESGFTGARDPSPCYPEPSGIGRAWVNKVEFITGLNKGAGPKAYVTENSICPVGKQPPPDKKSHFDLVEYTVASYLMVKNRHTYLFMFFSDGTRCGIGALCDGVHPSTSWPHMNLRHGAPVGQFTVSVDIYSRMFEHALALVNPSGANTGTFDLGAEIYYRYNCVQYTGRVVLPPVSGMVLLKDQPRQC